MDPQTPQTSTPPDLTRAFWTLVVIFNISLLATTLGILLALFRNLMILGAILTLIGIGLGVFGYQRYTHYRYEHTFTHEP